jgi:hypothetical protein
MGPYEARYAALAEILGALLLTADVGFSRVRGLSCRVELPKDPLPQGRPLARGASVLWLVRLCSG